MFCYLAIFGLLVTLQSVAHEAAIRNDDSGYQGREPMNLEWSAEVRFDAQSGLRPDVAGDPKRVT
jgi:hypothetical protein